MTEEVKEKLLSEIGKSNANWKKPEKMLVFKRKNIAYSAYYNEKTGKFGPLSYIQQTLPSKILICVILFNLNNFTIINQFSIFITNFW